jgi:hypothetical protein
MRFAQRRLQQGKSPFRTRRIFVRTGDVQAQAQHAGAKTPRKRLFCVPAPLASVKNCRKRHDVMRIRYSSGA